MDANRRRFMHGSAVTLAALGAGCAGPKVSLQPQARSVTDPPFVPLGEGHELYLSVAPEQTIRQAHELGRQLSQDHGGCARCAVAALQQSFAFGPPAQGLFRAVSCMDGGMTPHGQQNCGAFNGAGMYIGWLCGTEAFASTRLSHRLIRDVYQRFEDRYGSILCENVRREANGDCPQVVANAACWTAEVLLTEFSNYHAPETEQGKADDVIQRLALRMGTRITCPQRPARCFPRWRGRMATP